MTAKCGKMDTFPPTLHAANTTTCNSTICVPNMQAYNKSTKILTVIKYYISVLKNLFYNFTTFKCNI